MFAMMLEAKPANIERFRVVVMVSLDFQESTDFAGFGDKPPEFDGTSDVIVSPVFFGVSAAAVSRGSQHLLFSVGGFESCGIVSANFFAFLHEVVCRVFPGAFLALVEMPIRHLRMDVEFRQRLGCRTFETCFHLHASKGDI